MSLFCQKCPDQLIETQEHVITCGGVILEINYTDLFNSNLNKVKPALNDYMKIWSQTTENT